MSFSKAKLKRFNEVPVGDSPSCSSTDRKDQIKKFLKDLKDSAKGDKNDKESKTPAKSNLDSDSESVKSSKSATMRLFRTPSLPHRLRFRQNSDISTPKKELQKDVLKGKEALQAAQVEIKNKTEMLQDYTAQIDELRTEVFQLKENETKIKAKFETDQNIKEKQILELNTELKNCRNANLELKAIEDKLIEKSDQLENEIKLLLESHEREVTFLTNVNSELELNKDKLQQDLSKLYNENQSLKNELEMATDELSIMKLSLTASDTKIQEKSFSIEKLTVENICLLEEIQMNKKQMENDMLAYAEESQKFLDEIDALKSEKNKISIELEKKVEFIQTLQQELVDKDIDLDTYRDEIRESYQDEIQILKVKYENQIQTMKEINEMKTKEIESIYYLDVAQLNRNHQDQLKDFEKRQIGDIERINEICEEKIRISEIQNEQKIEELEKNVEESVLKERNYWKCEIDKCQKIAESEIISSELEKQDLKTLLESAHDMLKEREEKLNNFEGKVTNGMDYYVRLSEQLESQIHDIRQECSRLMTEKYNYQLTLNNTRSTVNILMERLKKSDSDVEILKIELETTKNSKLNLEAKSIELEKEMKCLNLELTEYKNALQSLKTSSQALEREMKEKETIFEKLMTSEEETLETVNKIGKLFNEKIEQNIDKYFEMYVDLKRKYEARETYIKDMKSLLDEFATNIELARIELDSKDKSLLNLEDENKKITLENMTLKYRCQQFENCQDNEILKKFDKAERDVENPKECDYISNEILDSVLANLVENEDLHSCDKFKSTQKQNEKIIQENKKLKDTLSEQIRRNNALQEIIDSENSTGIFELKKMIEEKEEALKNAKDITQETIGKYNDLVETQINNQSLKNMENLKETNAHLKNKITQLQSLTKEQEMKINELQENIILIGTPTRKPMANLNGGNQGTPRTPKTPKSLHFPGGKENSPAIEMLKSPKILKPRN